MWFLTNCCENTFEQKQIAICNVMVEWGKPRVCKHKHANTCVYSEFVGNKQKARMWIINLLFFMCSKLLLRPLCLTFHGIVLISMENVLVKHHPQNALDWWLASSCSWLSARFNWKAKKRVVLVKMCCVHTNGKINSKPQEL